MKKTYLILVLFFSFLISCEDDPEVGLSSSGGDLYSEVGGSGGGGGSSSGGGSGGGDSTSVPTPGGQITAGEWSDLDNWSFWTDLLDKADALNFGDDWTYGMTDRISVHVTNTSGISLLNVKVDLLDANDQVIWESVTDNFGMAELWPDYWANQEVSQLKVRLNNSTEYTPIPYNQGVNELQFDNHNPLHKSMDIAFIVDATGSMGDELTYLQAELVDVVSHIKSDNPNVSFRLGSVFYRDEGDTYVTREKSFSTNTTATINFINEQSADGGGDFPEAVHTALQKSIGELAWSSTASSRIAFLLLDAPPHNQDQVKTDLKELIATSSEKGIKVIPIVASGIDKPTEYLMRNIAIATNGTYVFITNHSGIGGEHIEATVGDYEVEFLNELMIRLIDHYLE